MLKMLRNGSHSHRMRCSLRFGTISIISLRKEYLQKELFLVELQVNFIMSFLKFEEAV